MALESARHPGRLAAALAILAAAAVGQPEWKEGVPPPGPPWKKDFLAARAEAVRDSKPLFLYFTKPG